MCLCLIPTVKWDSGYLKPKAFLINTLDHRIDTIARENLPQSKKKKKSLCIDCFHDKYRVGKCMKVKQSLYFLARFVMTSI